MRRLIGLGALSSAFCRNVEFHISSDTINLSFSLAVLKEMNFPLAMKEYKYNSLNKAGEVIYNNFDCVDYKKLGDKEKLQILLHTSVEMTKLYRQGVYVKLQDFYICARVDKDNDFLVSFVPLSFMELIHHTEGINNSITYNNPFVTISYIEDLLLALFPHYVDLPLLPRYFQNIIVEDLLRSREGRISYFPYDEAPSQALKITSPLTVTRILKRHLSSEYEYSNSNIEAYLNSLPVNPPLYSSLLSLPSIPKTLVHKTGPSNFIAIQNRVYETSTRPHFQPKFEYKAKKQLRYTPRTTLLSTHSNLPTVEPFADLRTRIRDLCEEVQLYDINNSLLNAVEITSGDATLPVFCDRMDLTTFFTEHQLLTDQHKKYFKLLLSWVNRRKIPEKLLNENLLFLWKDKILQTIAQIFALYPVMATNSFEAKLYALLTRYFTEIGPSSTTSTFYLYSLVLQSWENLHMTATNMDMSFSDKKRYKVLDMLNSSVPLKASNLDNSFQEPKQTLREEIPVATMTERKIGREGETEIESTKQKRDYNVKNNRSKFQTLFSRAKAGKEGNVGEESYAKEDEVSSFPMEMQYTKPKDSEGEYSMEEEIVYEKPFFTQSEDPLQQSRESRQGKNRRGNVKSKVLPIIKEDSDSQQDNGQRFFSFSENLVDPSFGIPLPLVPKRVTDDLSFNEENNRMKLEDSFPSLLHPSRVTSQNDDTSKINSSFTSAPGNCNSNNCLYFGFVSRLNKLDRWRMIRPTSDKNRLMSYALAKQGQKTINIKIMKSIGIANKAVSNYKTNNKNYYEKNYNTLSRLRIPSHFKESDNICDLNNINLAIQDPHGTRNQSVVEEPYFSDLVKEGGFTNGETDSVVPSKETTQKGLLSGMSYVYSPRYGILEDLCSPSPSFWIGNLLVLRLIERYLTASSRVLKKAGAEAVLDDDYSITFKELQLQKYTEHLCKKHFFRGFQDIKGDSLNFVQYVFDEDKSNMNAILMNTTSEDLYAAVYLICGPDEPRNPDHHSVIRTSVDNFVNILRRFFQVRLRYYIGEVTFSNGLKNRYGALMPFFRLFNQSFILYHSLNILFGQSDYSSGPLPTNALPVGKKFIFKY